MPKSRSGHKSFDLKNTLGAFSTVEDFGHTYFIPEICKEGGSREGRSAEGPTVIHLIGRLKHDH
jgi:hypothetical protein